MNKIISGNINNDIKNNPKKNGWFMGHFMNDNSPFKNSDFEIKWGNHKKGIIKPILGLNKTAKTMSILISGKVLIKFTEEKEVILSKQGDYVFWGAGIYHGSEALTDAVTLTIRWPSIPNDQELFKK
ncbi:MAG TPA: signal peptidase I [Nanoarchaeota archaeon]|nr:signal peptidase I [Nanoarchaeota archaeon]HIH63858.1 signal peptidase I [Nanoarchaeota archaeon]HIJ09757.1 signal peptidase I [Nanoarchaeota archaeon]